MTAVPVHPALVAAYPVIYLFAANAAGQVTLDPLWVPLGISLAIGVAALVVGLALTRDLRRGALLATVALALFFSFGHVWNLTADVFIARRWLLLIYAAIGILAAVVIWRGGRWAADATRVVNVLAAAALAFNLVAVGTFALGMGTRTAAAASAAIEIDPDGIDRRDIYYFIFDRFAGGPTLDEIFRYDADPFLDDLRERGFYVAEDSWANYLKTPLSLMSSLNMEYLDATPFRAAATKPGDYAPMYAALRERRTVPATLKTLGYEYLHIGSFFEPSATNVDADRTLRFEEGAEFSSALWATTLLSMLGPGDLAADAADPPLNPRIQREHTLYQFEVIPAAARRPGPTFVFSHFMVPHPPYVFEVDGSMPSEQEQASRSLDEQYLEQVAWTSDRIIELIDTLLAGSVEEEPVIIIQADEGPFPDAYRVDQLNFRWDRATPAELQRKMGILNAYRLPGVDPEAAGLSQDISPVNSFRVVFNAYFGTDLPLLEDRVFIFDRESDLYALHEISRPTR